jgi:hypothetical protein
VGFLLLLTWMLLVVITNKNWLSARIHTKSAASHVQKPINLDPEILAVLHGVFYSTSQAWPSSGFVNSEQLTLSRYQLYSQVHYCKFPGKANHFLQWIQRRGSQPHEVLAQACNIATLIIDKPVLKLHPSLGTDSEKRFLSRELEPS